MVVLWRNLNMPAGPMNLLTEYTQRHFNMPLVCGRVVIYTPAYEDINRCDKIGFRSPHPPTPLKKKKLYSKSEYGHAFLAKAVTVWKNHLLSLLLYKRLLKLGSISLAWALCLCNLDVGFMQSGPLLVLTSLQLEGCASNDI